MQILTGTTKAGAILPRLYPWQPDGVISIERLLVWAVREQKALDRVARVGGLFEAEARAAGLPWQGASACGCVAIERIGAVGARIDVSAPDAGHVHEIADAVVDIAISGDAHLALYHARTNTRPSLQEPARWLEPELLSRSGVPMASRCGTVRSVRYIKRVRTEVLQPIMWTQVRPVWGLAERQRMVARYRAWERELRWLAGVVSTRFAYVAVTCEAPCDLGHLEAHDFV